MFFQIAFSRSFAIILLTLTILSMGSTTGHFMLEEMLAQVIVKYQEGRDWIIDRFSFMQVIIPSWEINYMEADQLSIAFSGLLPILAIPPVNFDETKRVRTYRTPALLIVFCFLLVGITGVGFVNTGFALAVTYISYAVIILGYWSLFVFMRSTPKKRLRTTGLYLANIFGAFFIVLMLIASDLVVIDLSLK